MGHVHGWRRAYYFTAACCSLLLCSLRWFDCVAAFSPPPSALLLRRKSGVVAGAPWQNQRVPDDNSTSSTNKDIMVDDWVALEAKLERKAKEFEKAARELAKELSPAALEAALERKAKEVENAARDLAVKSLERGMEAAADVVEELSPAALEAALERKAKELETAARELAVKGLERSIEVADPGRFAPPGPEDETLTVTTYLFGQNDEFWTDLQLAGVSRTRFIGFTALAAGLAVIANLFGITSGLLSLSPEQSRKTRLDVLFPIRGFKRYLDSDDGYEMLIPQEWVADTALALAEQRERVRQLDPPSVTDVIRRQQGRAASLRPDAAFGPPGGDSTENVSIVKSTLMAGFSLGGTLGPPTTAAEKLLSSAIAPAGSGKTWELISASEETRGSSLVYAFEFRIIFEGSGRIFHNLCVVTNRENTLYTLTVLAPETVWERRKDMLQQIANSFQLNR